MLTTRRGPYTLPGTVNGAGEVTVMVEPLDTKQLLRKLNGAAYKEINAELKDESGRIANRLKGAFLQHALKGGVPNQAALVAGSAKVKRDRYVSVTLGGPKKVGRPYKQRAATRRQKGGNGKVSYVRSTSGGSRRTIKAPAGALLWGSEFGAARGIARFGYGRNPRGYWINPAVDDYAPKAAKLWREALNRALKEAGW